VQDQASYLRFGKGGVIYREGDPATQAFLVVEGQVELLTKTAGREGLVGMVTAGGLFGELALLNGETHMTTAVAVTDVRLAVVPSERFIAQVQASPPLVKATLRRLLSVVKRLKSQQPHANAA
jgi:CRP/FNR family transcriptional regulator, cyclic AMP receptor protein